MAETINKQKQIKVIEDPVEAVRKLPDVYLGRLAGPGFLNMYREIVQNSLDEIVKGNTLDKNIIISYDARTQTVIVEDNGQGIDINMLVQVFSILHSSSNYDKVEGSGDYSAGKNGMGATITNFLSRFFVVESGRTARTDRDGLSEFRHAEFCTSGRIRVCACRPHAVCRTYTRGEPRWHGRCELCGCGQRCTQRICNHNTR